MENSTFENLFKYKLEELNGQFHRNKYIEKKIEYKTKKKIMDIMQNLGIGIFGGAIRDQILHEKGSKQFYEFYDKYTNENTINIPTFSNLYNFHRLILAKPMNQTYCDPNFHPTTFLDRNTILNDIDCVMDEIKFNRLIEKIYNLDKTIKIIYKKHNNFKNYIHIKDSSEIIESYITLFISLKNKYNNIKNVLSFNECLDMNIASPSFNKLFFKIDVFIYKEKSNIFQALNLMSSNSDYFCNSLYLLNNRLSVNEYITRSLLKPDFESCLIDYKKKKIDIFLKKHIYKNKMVEIIIKQIENRYAYPIICNIIQKRMTKMMVKNFKIFFEYNFFENTIINNENCILCREIINDNNNNIRMVCCNACYHSKCFLEIINRHKNEINKCYMCSKMINYHYIQKNYFS